MDSKYDNIKKQFMSVIEYSQQIPESNVDKIFDSWYENKKWMVDMFGGNLIYIYPEKVTFHLSPEKRRETFNKLCDTVYYDYGNRALYDFLRYNEDNFFTNITVDEYVTSNGTKIPKGMKISKAFKFFEPEPDSLEQLQIKASMAIQEEKVTGDLCFSVHPLDFLSTSENTYKWRSCHALDGEYRAGNLSYMMDDCTMICYLKGADNEKLPNFPNSVPWNSKKWRLLLFFNKRRESNMLWAGRQYPFHSDYALELIRDIIFYNKDNLFYPEDKNADENSYLYWGSSRKGTDWSQWNCKYVEEVPFGDSIMTTYAKYVPVRGHLYSIKKIVEDAPNATHYNDLLYSTCSIPYYMYNRRMTTEDAIKPSGVKLVVGSEVPCVHCGNAPIDKGADSMLCEYCLDTYGSGDYYECACCGHRYHIDLLTYIESTGDYVCEECFNKHCICCEDCGQAVWKDDAVYIEKADAYVCSSCARNYSEDDD